MNWINWVDEHCEFKFIRVCRPQTVSKSQCLQVYTHIDTDAQTKTWRVRLCIYMTINTRWAMVLMRNCANLFRTWNKFQLEFSVGFNTTKRLIAMVDKVLWWRCSIMNAISMKNTYRPQSLSKLMLISSGTFIQYVASNWKSGWNDVRTTNSKLQASPTLKGMKFNMTMKIEWAVVTLYTDLTIKRERTIRHFHSKTKISQISAFPQYRNVNRNNHMPLNLIYCWCTAQCLA